MTPITTASEARAYLEGSLPNSELRLACFVCDAPAGQPCDPDCPELGDLIDAFDEPPYVCSECGQTDCVCPADLGDFDLLPDYVQDGGLDR